MASQRQSKQEKETEGYSRKEFSYQSFQRSFELPQDVVDEEKIAARYENGLLHLTIPKKRQPGRKRQGLLKLVKITKGPFLTGLLFFV
ncbi:Hsp20/alpha crystallin family protein [Niabella hibiscisoli]|uniref:Hsp20/alpha crystallin family protein n=1 Tax=Niabella hibiscisoli TaxID=1825928 RepID=UPI001F1063F9|nr:Hsp20/alpha crystallin family protein [Niabella hibiscisoli]MCH5718568.1 Hsp20/alpha crystallin family protein [Niabella hibiscisoli]